MKKKENNAMTPFIFMCLILSGCTNDNYDCSRLLKMQHTIDAIPRVVDNVQYSKDSLQIIDAIRWGFRNDTHFFNDYVMLGSAKTAEVNIYVDRIFYSLDTSKLFAMIILEKPTKFSENKNAIKHPENKYYYSGITIISNKKINNNWILYPISWYRPMGYSHYDQVKCKFYSFFLNEMLQAKYFDYYQCTIDQDCFWSERNGYWRYGEIIHGYYNFEVNANKEYFKETGIKVDSTNLKQFIFQPLGSR